MILTGKNQKEWITKKEMITISVLIF